MTSTSGKLGRGKLALLVALLALATLGLVEIGRHIARRPATLLKSPTPQAGAERPSPMNALREQQR